MSLQQRLKSIVGNIAAPRGDNADTGSSPTDALETSVDATPQLIEGPSSGQDLPDVDLGDVQAVEHIDALLAYEGPSFVESCYLSFLGRPSDPEGLAAHVGLLEDSGSKIAVAYTIARSDEAREVSRRVRPLTRDVFDRRLDELNGLDITEDVVRDLVAFAKDQAQWMEHAEAIVTPDAPDPTEKPPAVAIRIASHRALESQHPTGGLWVDMTTSFEWSGGIIGIIRAELEIAVALKRADPRVRFSMQVGNGFVEIHEQELQWLITSDNVTDAYMTFFGRYNGAETESRSIHVEVPKDKSLYHPYARGDTVLSVGWIDSRKEVVFERIKKPVQEYVSVISSTT